MNRDDAIEAARTHGAGERLFDLGIVNLHKTFAQSTVVGFAIDALLASGAMQMRETTMNRQQVIDAFREALRGAWSDEQSPFHLIAKQSTCTLDHADRVVDWMLANGLVLASDLEQRGYWNDNMRPGFRLSESPDADSVPVYVKRDTETP